MKLRVRDWPSEKDLDHYKCSCSKRLVAGSGFNHGSPTVFTMTLGNWNGLDHSGPDTNLDQTMLLMTKQDWVCLDHPRQNITVSNDTYRIWQTPGNWRLHHSIQTTLQRKGSELGWTGPNFFYIRSVNFFVCVCFILFGIFCPPEVL